jgi:hypothetical protein
LIPKSVNQRRAVVRGGYSWVLHDGLPASAYPASHKDPLETSNLIGYLMRLWGCEEAALTSEPEYTQAEV